MSQYQKCKPVWILLKQEKVSGSGISWAICKSAPRSRQITMPVPHHSHTTVLIISAYRQACSFSDVSSLLLCWHIYIILVSLNWLKTESICLYTWQKAYDVRSTHTHPFNGPFSGTTRVGRYQKGKTNLDFTEDSEWQWHQLDHMQVCTSLQTDNRASNPPLSFLQAGCPSCRPINSVKALKTTDVSSTVESIISIEIFFISHCSTPTLTEVLFV